MANGKVAIITGAGSGIGRATAIAFMNEGYSVAIAGRRADKLDETIAMAGEAGERGLAVPTDISDPKSVEALFAKVKEKFGRLDVLFNNAGSSATGKKLEDLPYEDWMRVVNTNLTGTFLCTQQAFRIMKDQTPMGGRIINNGSTAAYAPRPDSSPYTSTKHGVTGLTKATSLDGRKYDIACGQIDIGNTGSSMLGDPNRPRAQAGGAAAPEPRMGLENVTRAVLYMASLPLEANVLFMTVMATKMPLVGRG